MIEIIDIRFHIDEVRPSVISQEDLLFLMREGELPIERGKISNIHSWSWRVGQMARKGWRYDFDVLKDFVGNYEKDPQLNPMPKAWRNMNLVLAFLFFQDRTLLDKISGVCSRGDKLDLVISGFVYKKSLAISAINTYLVIEDDSYVSRPFPYRSAWELSRATPIFFGESSDASYVFPNRN